MLREKRKWQAYMRESTEAKHRGGSSCSRVEGPLMGLERRGCASSQQAMDNPSKAGKELDNFLHRLKAERFHENGWQKPGESRGSQMGLLGARG